MFTLLPLTLQSALACGGLACNGPVPVVQNAERIAFHVDEQSGIVETHVQVFYEGPPDEFAWIVPVQSDPDVFLSTDQLFDTLGLQLAPVVQVTPDLRGNCFPRSRGSSGLGCTSETSLNAAPRAPGGLPPEAPVVEVVSDEQVGPYDIVVLQADTSDALLDWLDEQAFPIPDGLEALLQPYLSEDAHFLAVRMSKDADVGDIAPLGWTYEGDAAAIPIQLTALAAAPDLRLEVSVFGEHRAVPESYLHVRVNEAQLDWFSGGSNYYDVVSAAADQAGGHAFATDFAGPTLALRDQLWVDADEQTVATLAGITDPADFARVYLSLGLAENSNVLAAFGRHDVAVTANRDLLTQGLAGVDLEALYEDLETYVFEPLRRAERLTDATWVTRLSSSLDADEMTVDPVFVLNPDAEQSVSNIHAATLYQACTGGNTLSAKRWIRLPDGRDYRVPSAEDVLDDGQTDSEWWLANASDIQAISIEQFGRSGDAELIADLMPDTVAFTDAVDAGVEGKGCGCAPASAPWVRFWPAFLGAMLFVAGLARRR